MIVIGGLLAAWGAIVLWFARPVHGGRRALLRSMRAGAGRALPGAEPAETARGLVWMRRAGFAGLVAGLVLSALGAIRMAVESM